MEATSNPTLKNFFHPLMQHLLQTIKNAKSSLSIASTTKSHPARLPLAPFGPWPKLSPKTFANHPSLHLKLLFHHSFFQGQSFCVSLCLQLQPRRPRVPTTSLPPSNFTMSPIKFSIRKVRQTLLQLDTSKSKGPDGIPAIVLKTCAPDLGPVLNKLFQLSYTLGTFPNSWKLAHVFSIPKKVTSLIHSTTIVPLQSLHSYLKQWRPLSLNNFLPSLKQTIFSQITSMAFESQV